MKNNKLITFFILAAIFFTIAASKKGNYTVQGTVNGAQNGDTVLMLQFEGWAMIPIDTTVIKNGKYRFKGSQDKPVLRYIFCKKNGESIGGSNFILENGKITVNLEQSKRQDVKGTANNLLWNFYVAEVEKQSALADPFYQIKNDTTVSEAARKQATEKTKQLELEQQQYNVNFIKDHIKTGVAQILLESNYQTFALEDVELISQAMKQKQVNNDLSHSINQYIDGVKKTKIGSQYSDLKFPNEQDQIVNLSDYIHKNKVTMIDFWASWCAPCLAEIPHLVTVYDKYKPQGFEIVGISLDKNKESWKNAITSFGMTWPQMSDLKGWKSAASNQYGVTAIPFTLLVDQDGKIIGKNLHGKDLENKLNELLK